MNSVSKILKNKELKRYLVLLFGLFVATLAFNLFLLPHKIVATGSFGAVLISHHLFNTDEATFVFVMNIVLIALSFFVIGRRFAINAFAGAVIFLPLMMKAVPVVELVPDTLMSVLVAGVLNGICVICLFYSNGSAGGTTIVGKIISKFGKVKLSTGIAISDTTVVICGLFIFGLQNTLYGLLSITVTRLIAHFFETGFSRTNSVLIISDLHQDIIEKISLSNYSKFEVIKTNQNAEEKRQTVICLLAGVSKLKRLRADVLQIDSKALIIVSTVSQIYGHDFASVLS